MIPFPVCLCASLILFLGKINNVKDVPEDFFYQVSCGNDHVCGLLADNSIKCWGSDSHFEYIPAHEMYSQISGSYYHFCAIERETMFVKCWGPNFFNECNAPSMVQFRQVYAFLFRTCFLHLSSYVVYWLTKRDTRKKKRTFLFGMSLSSPFFFLVSKVLFNDKEIAVNCHKRLLQNIYHL